MAKRTKRAAKRYVLTLSAADVRAMKKALATVRRIKARGHRKDGK